MIQLSNRNAFDRKRQQLILPMINLDKNAVFSLKSPALTLLSMSQSTVSCLPNVLQQQCFQCQLLHLNNYELPYPKPGYSYESFFEIRT